MKRSFLFILCIFFFAAASFAAEKEIHWGYSTSSIDGGFGSATSASGAIYIPAEVAQLYKGCTLKGVVAGLSAEATSVTVFATKTLGGENLASGTKTSASAGDNSVLFAEPYTIDGSAFYVGYQYSGSSISLGCCNIKNANGCWTNTGSGWQDNSSQGKTLNIRAVISGDTKVLPNDGALLTIDQNAQVEMGQTLKLSGRYVSFSPNFTKTYTLKVSVDGVEQKTVNVTKINVGPNVENAFSVELDPFTAIGTHTVDVTLTKFGTADDAYTGNNTVSTTVNVTKRMPARRYVQEIYTALTCGWCPAAGVSMKRLYEQYPDNYIGIEVYADYYSTLYAPTYSEFSFNGTPTSVVNRTYYPSTSIGCAGIVSAYMQQTGLKTDVDVTVKGNIVEGTQNKVQATATATFVNSKSTSGYRWAFVVTENDITDKEYLQKNYYANNAHGEMDGWESLPDRTAAVPPTHVARAIYDYRGLYSSFPTSVTEDEPVEYSKELELPENIADNSKLNIIALLLNSQTNEIVNAAEAQITGGTSSIAAAGKSEQAVFGVADGKIVAGNGVQLSVYTANGEQVENANLKGGLYIVKAVKNGMAQTGKVIVK